MTKVTKMGRDHDGVVQYRFAKLNDGRSIQFFANAETNLVVVDIVDADEQGGVEVYRENV